MNNMDERDDVIGSFDHRLAGLTCDRELTGIGFFGIFGGHWQRTRKHTKTQERNSLHCSPPLFLGWLLRAGLGATATHSVMEQA